jgi:hypothetical protein
MLGRLGRLGIRTEVWWKDLGKQSLGRQKRKCEDNIRKDVKGNRLTGWDTEGTNYELCPFSGYVVSRAELLGSALTE